MGLTVYVDVLSQPCRAILLFLNANNISFEQRNVSLVKGEQGAEEFQKKSPVFRVPCIEHDGFLLFESGAILKYLASVYKVADHWYPCDVKQRARVDEAVAWQHSALYSLRKFGVGITANKVLYPIILKTEVDEKKLDRDINGLEKAVTYMETMYLNDTPFIIGNDVSIADLLSICELIQPVMAGYDIFAKHPKLQDYRERLREKMNPFWDELHKNLTDLFGNLKGVSSKM